jgi:hypothetical protein
LVHAGSSVLPKGMQIWNTGYIKLQFYQNCINLTMFVFTLAFITGWYSHSWSWIFTTIQTLTGYSSRNSIKALSNKCFCCSFKSALFYFLTLQLLVWFALMLQSNQTLSLISIKSKINSRSIFSSILTRRYFLGIHP